MVAGGEKKTFPGMMIVCGRLLRGFMRTYGSACAQPGAFVFVCISLFSWTRLHILDTLIFLSANGERKSERASGECARLTVRREVNER